MRFEITTEKTELVRDMIWDSLKNSEKYEKVNINIIHEFEKVFFIDQRYVYVGRSKFHGYYVRTFANDYHQNFDFLQDVYEYANYEPEDEEFTCETVETMCDWFLENQVEIMKNLNNLDELPELE